MKRKRAQFGKASYDLDDLKKLIDEEKYVITRRCRQEFSRIDYSLNAVIEVIKRLRKNEIYKTMPSEKIPELMQDVYHTTDRGNDLYIKLQKSAAGDGCIIIQFKLK